MSLDLGKLESVRELGSGIVQARCPACAEGGGDSRGEHLRVYPDGRFGCCVHPKDREHRKRIFALAGDRQPTGRFTVRISGGQPTSATVRSVKASLHSFAGTLGTAKTNSGNGVPAVPSLIDLTFGTPGTPVSNPRAYGREEDPIMRDHAHTCKDFESGVPSVPRFLRTATERMPYLTPGGTLVIPFDSPERFHWWQSGQSIAETRRQILNDFQTTTRKEADEATV